VLRQLSFERGDPRFLFLDDGEQLDDCLAHDERGLFPTGGIQGKPCRQWDKGHHCVLSWQATAGAINGRHT
jgi:hypothetical protein